MRKSRVRLYVLSRKHLVVCAACILPLLVYIVLRKELAASSQTLTISRLIAVLTALLALWALIRALSRRIPQFGAPYCSDDGTVSGLSEEIQTHRDLSIPWFEVTTICIEFLIFAGVWILVFM